jgi:hypothetical protein
MMNTTQVFVLTVIPQGTCHFSGHLFTLPSSGVHTSVCTLTPRKGISNSNKQVTGETGVEVIWRKSYTLCHTYFIDIIILTPQYYWEIGINHSHFADEDPEF